MTIDESARILNHVLEEVMVSFDSDEDRLNFILDIVDGFRKQAGCELPKAPTTLHNRCPKCWKDVKGVFVLKSKKKQFRMCPQCLARYGTGLIKGHNYKIIKYEEYELE